MKIRTRLLVTSLLLFAAGTYWFVDWVLDDLRYHYFMTMEESMIDSATILSSLAAPLLGEAPGEARAGFRQRFDEVAKRNPSALIYDCTKTNVDLRVLITDTAGMVVFDSDGGKAEGENYSRWRDVRLTLAGQYGARATLQDKNDPDSLTFFVAAPVFQNGKTLGVLSVGKPIRGILPFLGKAKARLTAAGLTAAGAVLLLQILVSSWVTRPIRTLTAYAQAVRDGQPVQKLRLPHSEIGRLAGAFEEMRDALEGRKYVERYVQALTHEMKSPLAAVQGAAELLEEEMPDEQRRRFLRNIRVETQRMHDLIERLLELVGLEKRKKVENAVPVRLAALAEDVLDALQPVIRKKAVEIRRTGSETVQVTGEYFLLRQALANLMQNALDFSPSGGTVQLELAEEPGAALIRICDDGPGIPEYALERVFERFYSLPRPDNGKKSSGLGLNFVREISKLHGGEIRLNNRAPHGVEAVLRLPATV